MGIRIREAIGRTLWPADPHLRVLIAVFAVVLASLSAWEPGTFPQASNFTSMALQISDLGVLSLAMTLAMILAGIDLSIVAVANLSSILSALSATKLASAGAADGLTTLVAVLVGLVVGVLAGMGNGVVIGYLRVPPILATLATMTLWGGVATVLTGGVSVPGGSVALEQLGTQAFALVPVPTLILIVCVIAVWLLLNRSPLGVKAYLLGANSRASLFSGVNNGKVTVAVYTVSGLLAGVAGIINMARTNSANPTYGASYILLTILIAVLGGVSVAGGSGRVAGVVLSLVTLQMLSTGLNMILVGSGGSNFFKNFAWGVLLLAVVSASRISYQRFRRGRRVSDTKEPGHPVPEPAAAARESRP
ncbi:MAG: permease component of ribose/xylose/arabinose/galactoside ABC-type transporter [Sphaerisporangium sp.]|nr:permease component of ribose/xylose/arabinose/galactoside ABC-type transporter [Sphaerisporangium sp.]